MIKTMWKAGYAEFGYLKLLQPASNFCVTITANRCYSDF